MLDPVMSNAELLFMPMPAVHQFFDDIDTRLPKKYLSEYADGEGRGFRHNGFIKRKIR